MLQNESEIESVVDTSSRKSHRSLNSYDDILDDVIIDRKRPESQYLNTCNLAENLIQNLEDQGIIYIFYICISI